MHLHEAVLAFTNAKRAANRSPKTIKWYDDQLGVFQKWVGHVDLDDITTILIEAYMEAQIATGIGDRTLHARYRSLRAFLNWSTSRGYLSANPIDQVEEPKQSIKEPKHITYDEFLVVTGNIADKKDPMIWIDHRDMLIMHLLFWSGVRSRELLGLQTEDIRLPRMTVKVNAGKGDKERIVPMSPEIPRYLRAYLYSRPGWDQPMLLVGSDGSGGIRGVLTDSGLRQMLR